MLTDHDHKSTNRLTIEQCELPHDPFRLTRRFLNKLAERNESLFYHDGGQWISRYSEDRVEGVTPLKKEIVRQMVTEFIQSDLKLEKVRRCVIADTMLALRATCYTERKI